MERRRCLPATIIIIIVVFTITVVVSPGKSATATSSTMSVLCNQQTTCGTCMGASPDCLWCLASDLSPTAYRCDLRENLITNCSIHHIVNHTSEVIHIRNEPPRSPPTPGDPIQMSPQEVKLNLRPGKPFELPITFKMASNYPVDIYFVMDTSNTMKAYSKSLAQTIKQLVANISTMTSDYRFGFGSFVDKAILPFVSTDAENLVRPCNGCVAAYGFRNHFNLTMNIDELVLALMKLDISGNLDAPEGSFDAIVQAVVCKEIVGWRQNSRKIVLLFTDASFHIAGDGKLAGIVKPNDLRCHLDANGYYSESTTQDYPSIYQLATVIEEHKINLIFAVTEDQSQLYELLSGCIAGSNVGQLGSHTEVLKIVTDNYYKIQRSVHLTVHEPENISVLFQSQCLGYHVTNTSVCDGVLIGQTVMFNAIITVSSCLEEDVILNIKPLGIAEMLTVRLKTICYCDCEEEKTVKSKICHGKGELECGVCLCDETHYGKNCECEKGGVDVGGDSSCIRVPGGEVCSGRGYCHCGQCHCNPINSNDPSKKYSARWCQCNDFTCDYAYGKMCGGNGRCKCGKCLCQSNYTGSSCDCPLTSEMCIASNGKVCNGKGECKCGVCDCTLDPSFKGATCEECPTCLGKCGQNAECASCYFASKGDPCHESCTTTVISVAELPETSSPDEELCQHRDEDKCNVMFIYNQTSNSILVQRTKECISKTKNIIIIVSVVCLIIAIGIVLLIVWKTVITVYDRREFQAFERERANAKWNTSENPLYKGAVSNFKNPTFKPKEL